MSAPPSLGSKPSLSGSMQQARFLGALVHGAGGREKDISVQPSLILRNGLGHSFNLVTYSLSPFLVFMSPCAK